MAQMGYNGENFFIVKRFLKTVQILVVLGLVFAVGCKKDEEKEKFKVGESYQGGIIAYIDKTGEHGLIVAPEDQSSQWWNDSYVITGATGTAIGTGKSNTTAIVQTQEEGKYAAGYAAQLCNDLVLNGYSDWYLPSKDELNILYRNRNVIGGFNETFYWSSSEYNGSYAWIQNFADGSQYGYIKGSTYRFRAVRAF